MRRLLVVAPVVLLASLSAPIPASAGVFSSAGARCTIVGTSGDDKLVGTSGKDVLCGLGGNDVIDGRGGNDVVDGGSGNDVVRGGGGHDRVLGGGGNDRTDGGPGADRVDGGRGNDVVTGGDGGDLVLGGSGNDDLNGQAGRDALNGGAGTNWCTVGSTDTQKACVYDKAPPTVVGLTVVPATVDVTSRDVPVKVRLHVTDDTGVEMVNASASAMAPYRTSRVINFVGSHLVSGTVRDGIWELGTVLRRYSEPGRFEFDVSTRDRVGRSASSLVEGPVLNVIDRNPDNRSPVVRSVGFDKQSVDVRTAPATVTVTAQITDDLSGTWDVDACFWAPGESMQQVECPVMQRVSGTARDGRWRVSFTLPRGSLGGDWNVSISTHDKVGNNGYHYGEDIYREWTAGWQPDANTRLLAGGRFAVAGSKETAAAWLRTVKVDRPSVDTLPGDQTVNMYVRAADVPGEGVTQVSASLSGIGAGMPHFRESASLHQGTRTDGWWRLSFLLPQGTPPGRYELSSLNIVDKGHFRTYELPNAPYIDGRTRLVMPAGSTVTTDGAAWDGAVTVVANPAG